MSLWLVGKYPAVSSNISWILLSVYGTDNCVIKRNFSAKLCWKLAWVFFLSRISFYNMTELVY